MEKKHKFNNHNQFSELLPSNSEWIVNHCCNLYMSVERVKANVYFDFHPKKSLSLKEGRFFCVLFTKLLSPLKGKIFQFFAFCVTYVSANASIV